MIVTKYEAFLVKHHKRMLREHKARKGLDKALTAAIDSLGMVKV